MDKKENAPGILLGRFAGRYVSHRIKLNSPGAAMEKFSRAT